MNEFTPDHPQIPADSLAKIAESGAFDVMSKCEEIAAESGDSAEDLAKEIVGPAKRVIQEGSSVVRQRLREEEPKLKCGYVANELSEFIKHYPLPSFVLGIGLGIAVTKSWSK